MFSKSLHHIRVLSIVGMALFIISCAVTNEPKEEPEPIRQIHPLSEEDLHLIALCEQRDAEACRDAGVSLYQGKNKRDPANDAQALQLLLRSCNLEFAEGCTWAGRVQYGSVALRDAKGNYFRKSHNLYAKACQLESALGCNLLGNSYYSGGTLTAKDMSLRSFQRACSLGFPNACTNVGWLHNEENFADYDVVKARYFFNYACEKYNDNEGCEEREKLDATCLTNCDALVENYWQQGRNMGMAALDPFKSWQLACDLGDADICAKVASL